MKPVDERALPDLKDPERSWAVVLENDALAKSTTWRFIRGLVHKEGYVHGYDDRSLFEELYPVALEAFVRAADNYDDSQAKLSTYAVTCMFNALRTAAVILFKQVGYIPKSDSEIMLLPFGEVEYPEVFAGWEDRIEDKADAKALLLELLDRAELDATDKSIAFMYAHGASEEEIADTMGLTENGVHHAIYGRIFKRIRNAAA